MIGEKTPFLSHILFLPKIIYLKIMYNLFDVIFCFSMIRIELNQTHQEYYSGFDAILLVGSTHRSSKHLPELKGSLMDKILKLGLHNTSM